MRNWKAILAGTPRGMVVIAVLIPILLTWLALSNVFHPLAFAQACADDWEAAIDAARAGATEYQGTCVGLGGLDRHDISDLEVNLEIQRTNVENELSRFSDDIWGTAGGYVGAMPMILFAVLAGASLVGTSLSSGLTAWSLSNGWTRSTWIKSALGLTFFLTALAYLLLTVIAALFLYLRIRGMGLSLDISIPGLAVVTPLPGLFFYGLVAIGIALLLGKGEMAILMSIGFITVDYLVSGQFGRAPFVPSSFHSGALGAPDAKVNAVTGSLTLLAASVALTVLLYWYFIQRKDVPDR